MTSINTNNAALMASASARLADSKLINSFERLSSGLRSIVQQMMLLV